MRKVLILERKKQELLVLCEKIGKRLAEERQWPHLAWLPQKDYRGQKQARNFPAATISLPAPTTIAAQGHWPAPEC